MRNPLGVVELVRAVIEHVEEPSTLRECACVNRLWNVVALQKLFKGSMNDMKFRTPNIGDLNCLFVASRSRFSSAMSFVDHLIIAPEEPAQHKTASTSFRTVCLEKCRALRDRNYSKALLRPEGRKRTSLAIPFELINQNLSPVADLILHPELKFLTIDDAYCNLFLPIVHHLQDSAGINKPLKLKALSIHRSNSDLNLSALSQLLQICDLELFNLQEQQRLPILSRIESGKLLRCLKGQKNLKAIALSTQCGHVSLGETSLDQGQIDSIPWSQLQALHLQDCNQTWSTSLPRFRKLTILRLRDKSWQNDSFVKHLSNKIAQCSQLKIVDVELMAQVQDAQCLLNIASGCPFLESLCVRTLFSTNAEMDGEEFSQLLRSLPCVKLLCFDMKLHINGSKLPDLARHCPHLTMIELDNARMFLSYESLMEAVPFTRLQHMRIYDVWFEDPQRFIQYEKFQSLATEWCRVFPQLVEMPCWGDEYTNIEDGTGVSLGDHGAEESDGDVISSTNPKSDSHNPDAEWRILRSRVWQDVGYGKDWEALDKARHMWRSNFEINAFGWPVLPLEAFLKPLQYSTTSKDVH